MDQVELAPWSRKITIRFEGGSTPSPQQIAAIQEFIGKWPATCNIIKRPLFAYYRSCRDGATESGPLIGAEKFVLDFVEISSVSVPKQEGTTNKYIVLHGNCTWEEEHGLSIQIKDGSELLYVGGHESRILEGPRREKDWNFALPRVQGVILNRD